MDATMTPTWLEILPALPLVRGLPVIDVQPGFAEAIHGGVMLSDGVARFDEEAFQEDVAYLRDEIGDCVRVDLSDDLGFIYVVGWLIRRPWSQWMSNNIDTLNQLMGLWSTGDITDEYRVEVAELAAEVVG